MDPIVFNNTIPLDVCLNAVSSGMTKNYNSMIGIVVMGLLFFILMLIFLILYAESDKQKELALDYLRRRNALNDYENWKRERVVK